jgi:hypothetical protein
VPMGAAAFGRAAAGRLPPRFDAVDRPDERLELLPERERLVDRACCLVATCSPGVDADDRTGHPSALCPRRGDTTGVADQIRSVQWWTHHRARVGTAFYLGGVGGVGGCGGAMVAAGCRPPGRRHLHPHTPTAPGAVVRRIEWSLAGFSVAVPTRRAAPRAIRSRRDRRPAAGPGDHLHRTQITFDSAPMGMRRSSSICRSSCGDRPSVVR